MWFSSFGFQYRQCRHCTQDPDFHRPPITPPIIMRKILAHQLKGLQELFHGSHEGLAGQPLIFQEKFHRLAI